MNVKLIELTRISLLAAFISVTGMMKIPSFMPGAEFQLSAPIAIAIVSVFGFWRYLLAGFLSSSVLFFLGIHTILNIEISMVYRIVAGGIVAIFGPSAPVLLAAGPMGSIAARSALAATFNIEVWPLLLGAIPGMIFTMLTVIPLTKMLQRTYLVVNKKYAY
ncbi:hypothetical protein [Jeotgalibacillus marinus]|uniref:Uncharacterized protein n=1 Tax=Jeotgalibacillus marinus TaxID=86667 RepID=A0ABV3Q4M4_9BACL